MSPICKSGTHKSPCHLLNLILCSFHGGSFLTDLKMLIPILVCLYRCYSVVAIAVPCLFPTQVTSQMGVPAFFQTRKPTCVTVSPAPPHCDNVCSPPSIYSTFSGSQFYSCDSLPTSDCSTFGWITSPAATSSKVN